MATASNENKRAYDRRPIDNGKAYIDGTAYRIHDLSHGGFALSGQLPTGDPDKVYEIRFMLSSTNRQLETRCKIMKMWDSDEMCGFEFYKPSKQQMVDINNYLKALDAIH